MSAHNPSLVDVLLGATIGYLHDVLVEIWLGSPNVWNLLWLYGCSCECPAWKSTIAFGNGSASTINSSVSERDLEVPLTNTSGDPVGDVQCLASQVDGTEQEL